MFVSKVSFRRCAADHHEAARRPLSGFASVLAALDSRVRGNDAERVRYLERRFIFRPGSQGMMPGREFGSISVAAGASAQDEIAADLPREPGAVVRMSLYFRCKNSGAGAGRSVDNEASVPLRACGEDRAGRAE